MASSAALQSALAKNQVVLFTTSSCPFCIRSKNLLNSLQVPYLELNINDAENSKLFEEIEKVYKHETVPAVFVNKTFVGGNSELQEANSSGKLKTLLEK